MTIKELRETCQSVHKGDWTVSIVRSVSIYFTWMLAPTGITGNGVSAINCVVGVVSGVAFYFGGTTGLVLGVLLFMLNTILDCVDGEMARYRKTSSLTGLYADRINTVFLYPAIFYGAGHGLAITYDMPYLIDAGVIGGWAMLSLRLLKTSIDATLIDALTMSKARREESVAEISQEEEFRPVAEILRDNGKWYMIVIDYVTFRQSGMCIVWLLAVIAELLVRQGASAMSLYGSPFSWVIVGYALIGLVGVVSGSYIVIRKRKVERQFLSVFGDRM